MGRHCNIQPHILPDSPPNVLPDGLPDARPDAPADARADALPDEGPNAKPDAHPDSKPDAEPDAASDAKPDGEPDREPDGKPDGISNAKPDPNPDAKPDADPDVCAHLPTAWGSCIIWHLQLLQPPMRLQLLGLHTRASSCWMLQLRERFELRLCRYGFFDMRRLQWLLAQWQVWLQYRFGYLALL